MIPIRRRLALVGALYFAQGVPFGYFLQAFPVILRQAGYSLEMIGLSALFAAPWALKFAWAPLIDRTPPNRFGRRRVWLITLQVLTIGVLVTFGQTVQVDNIIAVAGMVLVVNLLSATQDIATDALAIDFTTPNERGRINGVQVGAYRAGMIVGGGLITLLHAVAGFGPALLAIAVTIAISTIPVLAFREVELQSSRRADTHPSVWDFVRRRGGATALLLVTSYKFGEGFGISMARPALVDAGFSLSDIALMLGTVGFAFVLTGGVIGGELLRRIGRAKALVAFGIIQTIAVGSLVVFDGPKPSMVTAYAVTGLEHFSAGLANVAIFTTMMDASSRSSSATDYTTQASAIVLATGVASILGGFSAARLGYSVHFLLAAAFCLTGAIVAGMLVRSMGFDLGTAQDH